MTSDLYVPISAHMVDDIEDIINVALDSHYEDLAAVQVDIQLLCDVRSLINYEIDEAYKLLHNVGSLVK